MQVAERQEQMPELGGRAVDHGEVGLVVRVDERPDHHPRVPPQRQAGHLLGVFGRCLFVGDEEGVGEPLQVILRCLHQAVGDGGFEAPVVLEEHGDGVALAAGQREDLAHRPVLASVSLGADGALGDVGFALQQLDGDGVRAQGHHPLEVGAVGVELAL
jgi:hypothetical protein